MSIEEILSSEEREAGFSVREEEGFLYLLRWGKVVAVFSSSGATRESIHEVVRQEMERQGKQ